MLNVVGRIYHLHSTWESTVYDYPRRHMLRLFQKSVTTRAFPHKPQSKEQAWFVGYPKTPCQHRRLLGVEWDEGVTE